LGSWREGSERPPLDERGAEEDVVRKEIGKSRRGNPDEEEVLKEAGIVVMKRRVF
tara:strand:+ start:839 stop:1003 length:165 start_codon:yes stop_codon:yes gene_type:complete